MQKHRKLIKCMGVSHSYPPFSYSWAPGVTPRPAVFNIIMTLSLIMAQLFELFIILFNYKYQFMIIHAPLISVPYHSPMCYLLGSLEFLNGYKAISL